MKEKSELWVCPRCDRRFVTKNMWHSCHKGTVDDFFAERVGLRPLFDELVEFVEEIGPFDVEVVKTRISFTTRARFANVIRLRRDGIVVAFWLKREIASERFLRVDHFGGKDWVYQVLLRTPDDLDDELGDWLTEAYRVGQQDAS